MNSFTANDRRPHGRGVPKTKYNISVVMINNKDIGQTIVKHQIRYDLEIIASLVNPNSRVLDIGCGDGELLSYLKQKNVDGAGIELSQKQVSQALNRGLSVIQGNAETDLPFYPDNSFDYAILSHTIQATHKPHEILKEMLRVAKYAIVSLPNFAHYKNRLHLFLKGSMPVNETIPYEWYETPNIHFCSIKDFEILCKKLNLLIKEEIFLTNKFRFQGILNNKKIANLFAEFGIFVLVKNELGCITQAEFVDEKLLLKQKVQTQFA